MTTYLAVPISAKNVAQAAEQIARAVAGGAEMLELRTDYLEDLSVESVKALLSQTGELPVIVTCRDKREGGATDYPEALRIDVLLGALEAGAEFIDVEYANFAKPEVRHRIEVQLAWNSACRLILSAHDFDGPFENVKRLYDDIVEVYPEAVPKLVYTANHINDCFAALDLLHEKGGRSVVLCMGQRGPIGRILAKKMGGLVTFASLDEASGTAPGQLTLGQFKELYRHDSIDASTELFGVIADPVAHSLSPAIHNACFADKQMNRLYLPLLVEGGRGQLYDFLDNVLARPWLDFRGFSVTIPHKHSALEYVRGKRGYIEPLAQLIGAANTLIVEQDGSIAAYNTDYAGALDAITEGMGIDRRGFSGMPVAVVGAGGVARAIVAGLCDAGADVTIYNRTVEKAEKLADDCDCAFAGLDGLDQLDAKLVVNSTSIGMHPNVDRSPVPEGVLKPDMAVFDTVYNPAETLLLKQAKAAGARTIDGIAMFVNQAMAQFQLFTNQQGNPTLMRNVVMSSGLRAQYSRTIADHRCWLRSFDAGYEAKWERLLKNNPEGAICEAAIRELLESQHVSIEPNDDLSHGGPDYRCTRDRDSFYVEVTCISRDAASEATGLRDHPWGGPPEHEMMTGKIRYEVSNKTRQCANLDGPCLVAICCLHSQAGGDACFDDCAAEEVLCGSFSSTRDYDPQTRSPVGETYEVTDLRDSTFIRPSKASGEPQYARDSVSGLLLCGFGSRPWVVRGVLHSCPAREFDRNLLPHIRFARLTDRSLRTGKLEVEWI